MLTLCRTAKAASPRRQVSSLAFAQHEKRIWIKKPETDLGFFRNNSNLSDELEEIIPCFFLKNLTKISFVPEFKTNGSTWGVFALFNDVQNYSYEVVYHNDLLSTLGDSRVPVSSWWFSEMNIYDPHTWRRKLGKIGLNGRARISVYFRVA